MSYPSDELKDDIDALTTGAHRLSEAANAIATITSGSDVVVENFDHLEEVLDNLQAFFDTLKGSTFYPPVGSISPFAGAAAYAPPGWLLCQGTAGTAVTSASFPDLYNVLTANGTVFPYGGSAGTTYTPDLRGRVPFGLNSANGDVDALSDNDGAALADRSPKHKHSFSLTATNAGPDHTHGYDRPWYRSENAYVGGGAPGFVVDTSPSFYGGARSVNTGTASAYTHSHPVSGSVGVGSGTNDAVPYVTVNYIIFAGKV